MTVKKCFKCLTVKDLTEFYKHPKMSDGRLNKCKECNKVDVRKNRSDNIDYYRAYDRERGNRQDSSYCLKYRNENPAKYRCHMIVSNAKRDGHLIEKPCEMCKSDKSVHAHHDDYSKPLDVRWLCSICHSDWHKHNTALTPF